MQLRSFLCGVLLAAGSAQGAQALETQFLTPGADEALRNQLTGASLVEEAAAAKSPEAQDLFAAARADYARLIGVLYDQGYYSGVISIRIDGHEADNISPMDAPENIGTIEISVTPGPLFHFAHAAIGPLAKNTTLPEGFRDGQIAHSGMIASAADAGVEGWRAASHAKARVSGQKIVADHRADTLSADITLDPGPKVTFGEMHISGNQRLRTKRLAEIAGFPTGQSFSPDKMEEVRSRLRRTGIFDSAALTEAETLRNGNILDADLAVVEAKTRRIGFGGELSSTDGMTLSGYWLHRNLLGGGEHFRIDAEASGIGGSTGGTDYTLGARLDRPATFTPDTSAYLESALSQLYEEDYDQKAFSIGFGLSHIFNPRLTGEAGIAYEWSQVTDDTGRQIFRQIALPTDLTWDNRDNASDATRGYYGKLGLTPFLGLAGTGSGAQMTGDFRTYRSLGADDRFVLAGRAQIGAVFGSKLLETPRDYLFYSGGGGTVRGQPYQSLGVSVTRAGVTHDLGGTRFLGFSGEFRAGITSSIGVVAFYDAGYVSAEDFSSGEWQSGAGLGLRYKTPIGPIRLDIAAPVSGKTGDGAQIYLGIGQAF
ncbi:MAG: autotransporter assembly complex family protein [Paenirhodobacter sp.]|uniref:autotransporter assembly complex protein TamA n=1 Tax=Paenirhodobacter sp. TaxID=1965326 RepID=UPI003D145DC7